MNDSGQIQFWNFTHSFTNVIFNTNFLTICPDLRSRLSLIAGVLLFDQRPHICLFGGALLKVPLSRCALSVFMVGLIPSQSNSSS